ncbi:3-keto-5-aminohexanoate cleavage protein [Polaromonas sp.]|uniref:3-keto-5-aminohexanoate cleavage protein n=1 Tax=Polaromonas sp. TaxID=1869339 RepID=UPI0032656C75
MESLVICAAITGGGPAKSPHHPRTPKEIAYAALHAWQAGAAMVHCHARLEDGTPTNAPHVYADLLARIKDLGCEAIINFSAGDNGGRSNHEERLSVINTGADIVSLGGGSFNIGTRLYDNSPEFRREMATRMNAAGVTPEFELFDLGQIQGLQWLADKTLLPAKPLVTIVTGVPGALPDDIEAVNIVLKRLPNGAHWSIACQTASFESHRRLMLGAFSLGGHIRTGMEDCVYIRPGVLAKSNAELVTQWVETAQIWGRPIATAKDARLALGLPAPMSDSQMLVTAV